MEPHVQKARREAVGVFDDPDKLDAAVAELEVTAFPRHDISVLKDNTLLQRKYGIHEAMPEWLEDNPDTPREILVRPEEKFIGAGVTIGCCAYVAGCAAALLTKALSGPALITAITGGSAAGGVIGLIAVLIVRWRSAKTTAQQIRKGGLLLWVRTGDEHQELVAKEILRRNGARHIHIHSIN